MLVVVRRKEDGMFYTNLGPRRIYRRGAQQWTEDIQQCIPFRGVRGVRSSFNMSPRLEEGHICTPEEQVASFAARKLRQSGVDRCCYPFLSKCKKNRQRLGRERFDELYEIVPVKLEVIK